MQTLGDLFTVSAGGDWDPKNCVKIRDSAHPYAVVANARTPGATHGYCKYYTVPGDTLSITGRGDVGHAVYRAKPFVPIVRVLALVPKRDLSSRFYAEYINARVNFSLESTGVPQLTAPQVRPYPLAFPPPGEQRAIARVLEAADEMIGALDRIIAKKQAIKQGMMQQLLTGKTRLPGYAEPWSAVTLGDVGTFKGGSGFPVRYQGSRSGDHPFYKVSDMNRAGNGLVMRTANNYVSEAQRKQMGAVLSPADAIVFAKVGAAIFQERKRILSRPSCVDNNMAALVLEPSKADVGFTHYVLSNLAMGSLVATTAMPSLNGGQLRSIRIGLPTMLEEQRAIAAALRDSDHEIDALGERLRKAHAIKEGMTQELLTSPTRLPVAEATS